MEHHDHPRDAREPLKERRPKALDGQLCPLPPVPLKVAQAPLAANVVVHDDEGDEEAKERELDISDPDARWGDGGSSRDEGGGGFENALEVGRGEARREARSADSCEAEQLVGALAGGVISGRVVGGSEAGELDDSDSYGEEAEGDPLLAREDAFEEEDAAEGGGRDLHPFECK